MLKTAEMPRNADLRIKNGAGSILLRIVSFSSRGRRQNTPACNYPRFMRSVYVDLSRASVAMYNRREYQKASSCFNFPWPRPSRRGGGIDLRSTVIIIADLPRNNIPRWISLNYRRDFKISLRIFLRSPLKIPPASLPRDSYCSSTLRMFTVLDSFPRLAFEFIGSPRVQRSHNGRYYADCTFTELILSRATLFLTRGPHKSLVFRMTFTRSLY